MLCIIASHACVCCDRRPSCCCTVPGHPGCAAVHWCWSADAPLSLGPSRRGPPDRRHTQTRQATSTVTTCGSAEPVSAGRGLTARGDGRIDENAAAEPLLRLLVIHLLGCCDFKMHDPYRLWWQAGPVGHTSVTNMRCNMDASPLPLAEGWSSHLVSVEGPVPAP